MSDVSDPPPVLLEEQLCFALYETSRAVTKIYGGLLKDLGLTYPQYLTMLILWERDGLSVQQIADRLGIEGATATPLIQRIERLGLLVKRRSGDDDRRLDIFLTEEGRQLRHKAADVPERLGCALGVSEAQAQSLLKDLRALRASMT